MAATRGLQFILFLFLASYTTPIFVLFSFLENSLLRLLGYTAEAWTWILPFMLFPTPRRFT